jgi:ABC-type Zn uptake system ZnuABC Zn-binding protein ZnuA
MSVVRAVAMLGIVAFAACSGPQQPTSSVTAQPTASSANARVNVVTTFSTLNSFVEGVGGSHVTVTNLVPVGASPEEYQPTPQDIATLGNAQVLVENGAGIEAWLQHTLQNADNPHLVRVICTDGLPVILGNPHLWMNPDYAKHYVEKIRAALTQVDPKNAADYAANARTYDKQLDVLSAWIQAQVDTIPKSQRKMIVFHNAWQYYNDRFGIQTLGVIETSPGQEPNPQQLGGLIDEAKAAHLRAVFSEPEYSPKLVQSLARSANVAIVQNLYDDSIGTDPRVHDYMSMLHYDTTEIVNALR